MQDRRQLISALSRDRRHSRCGRASRCRDADATRRRPAAGASRALACTSAATFSAFACGTGFCPTTATGAVSHRPTQGACRTRTSAAEQRRQRRQQLARAGHLAGDRVADAHGDRGRRRVAFLDHVEMVIERGHFVDFGHRQLHLGRERDQVRRGKAAEAILNPVQMLDQQIPPARERRREARARPRAPSDRRGGLSGLPRARLSACLFLGIVSVILFRSAVGASSRRDGAVRASCDDAPRRRHVSRSTAERYTEEHHAC